jgi:dienelactone hydrolase
MKSTRKDYFRRFARWATWVALLAVASAGLLLVWLATPRPGQFLERVSAVTKVETEPPRPAADGFVSQAVRLHGENGLRVDLRVLRPTGENAPLPLLVLVAGHRTGRDAVDLLGAPGPFVVAALDYPYDGPERPRGLRQSAAAIPAARRALADTPAAALMAIEWLAAQPWVDSTRMELLGVSLGSPFAGVIGALEPRIRRVWFIHGGAGLHAWLGHNLRERIKSDAFRRPVAWLAYALAHGPSLESELWVPRIAPRPVVVIGARDDKRLPAELIERLHEAVPGPKELIWMEGGHVDRRPEAVRQLLDLVRSRLEPG